MASILAGTAPDEIRQRASQAPFDERLSLLDSVCGQVRAVMEWDDVVTALHGILKEVKAGVQLKNLFAFAEAVWTGGQELLILVTELTVHYHAARFIARYGCDAYYRHNQELMFYQRKTAIIRELEQLSSEL